MNACMDKDRQSFSRSQAGDLDINKANNFGHEGAQGA